VDSLVYVADFQTWPLEEIDCPEMFADEIEGLVRWNDGSDVSSPAGKAVRPRSGLNDADVYAFRFL
jgi:hypothetical protein